MYNISFPLVYMIYSHICSDIELIGINFSNHEYIMNCIYDITVVNTWCVIWIMIRIAIIRITFQMILLDHDPDCYHLDRVPDDFARS